MEKYKIFYKLSHSNGVLVDESWNSPLEFELGDGQLDPCLESCIKEAEIGRLQTFLLSADEAFGQATDEAFQVINRHEFPQDMPIKVNMNIEFKTPTQESFIGRINKINDNNITVDFNHPLANCDISFQVKILEKL